MKTLAIIPARSGSKELEDKNIKLLNGKPLLAYTIEAAREAKIFEEIMVSTDSESYAEIAKKYGANVPYIRGKHLSGDSVTTVDVTKNCIEYYRGLGLDYEVICLLQPTSPLRKENQIREAYELFVGKGAKFLASVCECEHSPLWANTIGKDLRIDNFLSEEIKNSRRQDLPKYYRLNGAIYFAQIVPFLDELTFLGRDSIAYIMDNRSSVDIDTIEDFLYAEIIMGVTNKEF